MASQMFVMFVLALTAVLLLIPESASEPVKIVEKCPMYEAWDGYWMPGPDVSQESTGCAEERYKRNAIFRCINKMDHQYWNRHAPQDGGVW